MRGAWREARATIDEQHLALRQLGAARDGYFDAPEYAHIGRVRSTPDAIGVELGLRARAVVDDCPVNPANEQLAW